MDTTWQSSWGLLEVEYLEDAVSIVLGFTAANSEELGLWTREPILDDVLNTLGLHFLSHKTETEECLPHSRLETLKD